MTSPVDSPGEGLRLEELVVRRGAFNLGPISGMLPPGVVTALVGANGAGKTTLIRGLVGHLPVTSGRVLVDGQPVVLSHHSWAAFVGLLPDNPEELLEELTAAEYWEFLIAVHARLVPRADRGARTAALRRRRDELTDLLDFSPPSRVHLGEYSLGMRKKAQLVGALVGDPLVCIFDEPRNGLDPFGIVRLHILLDQLRDEQRIVLVASHDLDWATTRATRLLALRRGAGVPVHESENVVPSVAHILESIR